MVAVTADKVVVELHAKIDKYNADVRASTDKFSKQMQRMEDRAGLAEKRLSGFGRSIVPALGALTAALSVREIARYADAWTDAGNKIVASGTPIEDRAKRLQDLADVSVETRSSLEGTITTFARLERSMASLAPTQEKLLRYTETINKAFIVGGAAASEQRAGILQLSQGIASGMLQGDELRSIRENAPLVAKAIADAMGVGIGQLKALGAEGKITVNVISKALDLLAPEVDKAFAKTQSTISQSLTNLETRFTQFVGGLSESGATAAVADGINTIAENLDLVVTAATIAASALGPGLLAGALAAATVGFRTLTIAMMENPLGLVAVVAASAATAIYLYAKEQEAAAISLKKSNEAHRTALDLEKQVRDGRVELTASTIRDSIATKKSELAINERSAALLRVQALELEILKQRQKGANPQTAMQEGLALKQLAVIEKRIRDAKTDIASLEKNLPKTVGYKPPAAAAQPTAVSDPKAFDKAVARIQKQTAALDAKAKAENRTTVAMDYAAKKAELLAAADTARLARTPELIRQVKKLAKEYANAHANENVEKIFDAGEKRLEQIKTEGDLIGLTVAQAEARRFIEEQTNAILRERQITPKEEVMIEAQAEVIQRRVQANEDLNRTLEDQERFQDGIRDGLLDIGTAAILNADNFEDAAARILRSIAEMTLQLYVLKPLVESIFGQYGTSGSSSIVGSLGSLFNYDEGGYTGPGGKKKPAGIVHKGEVVFSQDDVRRHGGPAAVEAIRRGLPGYENGGPVAMPRMVPMPGSIRSDGGVGSVTINTNVNIEQGQAQTSVRGGPANAGRELANMIEQSVKGIMQREKRQGGILWNPGAR